MRRKWTRLTREQPITLAEIVKYSKKHANLVPKPDELAQILGIGKIAAKGRIARLRQFFTKKDNLEVNVERLCTEKETALFFLTIQQMSNESKDGRVFKSSLFENLRHRFETYFVDWIKFEHLWHKGTQTEYLVEVSPECVRTGIFIEHQIKYLEIIAES